MVDRTLGCTEGVYIFKFHLRAKLGARRPYRNVGFEPQLPLLHVRPGYAEVAQEQLERLPELPHLLAVRKIGLGDELHERHARAVKIHQGELLGGVARLRRRVEQTPGVLLEVHATYAYLLPRN